MTDQTFNTGTDQAPAGTNSFTTPVADQAPASDNGVANLQSQVQGMEKRLSDKDTHIGTIETENNKLREQMADVHEKLEKMSTIEEALERMQNSQQDSNQDTALDEDALVKKTLGAITQQNKEATAQQNFDAVAATLTKQFGADAVDTKVKQIAEENGLGFDDIVELSRKSPNAVYKMAGLGTTQTISASPMHSSHVGLNNEPDADTARERKLAEFAKLRRENATEYWKPEVQKEFRKLFI